MIRRMLLLAAMFLLAASMASAEPSSVTFVKKPVATRTAEGAKIEFAVSGLTDVAVFIENANGKIVRHLVAGVLGKNAPVPLKSDSLEQSVEWDGKADYGKAAGSGPFKVRVALGLTPKYDKAVLGDPASLSNIASVAVGPDGTVYVMHGTGSALGGGGNTVKAFSRDGGYLRTVIPFPASLSAEQGKAFDAFEVQGRTYPLVQYLNGNHGVPTAPAPIGAASQRKTQMAVNADGTLLLPLPSGHLAAVDGKTGAAPWGTYKGTTLPDRPRSFLCVVASRDGKSAFVGGLGKRGPAVYRVKLPERTPAEPFFGDPNKDGNDDTHLGKNGAGGLAVDAQGNVLISDPSNGRIVVVGGDGKLAGSIQVANPGTLATDPTSGAIYVLSVAKGAPAVVKFSGWKEPKELARVAFANPGGNGTCVMAADFSKKPVVVWVGTDGGKLFRVEESDDAFAAVKEVGNQTMGNAAFNDVAVDRFRPDREIYARCSEGGNWYWRLNEETGKAEMLRLRAGGAAHSALNVVPAPDGNIYCLRWPYSFYKHDHAGNQLNWEDPRRAEVIIPESGGKRYVWPPNNSYVPVSMGDQPHTLGVRGSDGHIFTMEPAAPGDRPPKMVREYLPTGKLVSETPLIWKVSDAALGPRFDAAGNIYIADVVRPVGWIYPPEFDKAFPARIELNKTRPTGAQDAVAASYGSIMKFGPAGGMIDVKSWKNPFTGEAKLDPSLKETTVVRYEATQLRGPDKVIGAEWIHPGISQLLLAPCNCENANFDVDEFGRVFFPDTDLFQVRVIDTAGNALVRFGSYGNADSCGPESKDKTLAQPEIAFGWLVGVGVTDKYVYCGDSMNRRLLRVKLDYAAEVTCELK